MKKETFVLSTKAARDGAISRLLDFNLDGKTKVIFSDSGNKTARQRNLQWLWYTETANSGIGGKHSDTKDGVHLLSKYRWALPILIRDDEFFAEIYATWKQKHGNDEERMRWFVDTQVHTEAFNTSQMAEFLTDFQRYYEGMVNLTNPDDLGLNLGGR